MRRNTLFFCGFIVSIVTSIVSKASFAEERESVSEMGGGFQVENSAECPIHAVSARGMVVVDLKNFRLCLYDADGRLALSSIASGGSSRCRDTGRPCKTPSGTYRIGARHGASYRSGSYPTSCGDKRLCGANMPYYLEFSGRRFGIHGGFVPRNPPAHVSHSCIRLLLPKAKALLFLVSAETRVLVLPY